MKMLNDKIKEWQLIDVPQTKEADFDAFWQDVLAKVAAKKVVIEGGMTAVAQTT